MRPRRPRSHGRLYGLPGPGWELFANAGVAWGKIECVFRRSRAWSARFASIGGGFLSTSQEVIQHLPYLRRYARALAGSQAAGDAYVTNVLETVVEDPSLLDAGASTRIALYQLFTKIWNSIPLNGKTSASDLAQPSERHLSQIAPLPRQAFLLLALEGLTEDDASKVLGVGVRELRALVDDSGREIAAEIATDVLIIEDEAFIALNLQGLVEALGHQVLGVARTHKEAVALAKVKRPGAILADIQLADGSSGLDAVNEMLNSFQVPVIFITAYPERLLTGERPEPAFLIPKPFQPAMVSAMLSQALFFEHNAKPRERRAS
jgi:CheY-like chemotaxis protein